MSKEVIYIDVKDDVTSIIDKVKKTDHKIIALVPPKQIGVLQSAVNLQLLAHAAKQASKVMVIITNQEALIRLAAVAKIPVAKSLTSKPEMPEIPALKVDGEDDIIDGSQLSVGELAGLKPETDQTDDEVVVAPADKLAPAKIKVPNYDKFRNRLIIAIVLIISLIGFGVWALVFASTAEITVVTNTKAVNVSSSISLVDQVNKTSIENNLIYAQLQKTTRTRSLEAQATGEKELKIHASGEVTVTKTTGSSSTKIPAGTLFVSSSGLKFTSVQDYTVPGVFEYDNGNKKYGTVKVTVKAADAGDTYNITPQKYSIPSFSSLFAEGGKMTGGLKRTVKVMTSQDFDKAKAELLKETHDAAIKELRNKFDSSIVVINESLQVSEKEIVADAKVDEEAKGGKFKVEQAVDYQIGGIARKTLEEYIGHVALKNNGSEKGKMKVYDAGSDKVIFNDFVSTDGRSSLRVVSQASIGPDIKDTEVKEYAQGKTKGEIQAHYSSIEGVKEVEVKLAPFWVYKVPTKLEKITVSFKK